MFHVHIVDILGAFLHRSSQQEGFQCISKKKGQNLFLLSNDNQLLLLLERGDEEHLLFSTIRHSDISYHHNVTGPERP